MGFRKIPILLSLFYMHQLEMVAATGCYSKPENEVCQTKQEIPHMYSRGTDTNVNEKMFDRTFCDVHAIDTGLWYYSMNNMTEHCPEMYKCGTQFPIWLNGSNPIAVDKIVNLTACLRDFDTCCSRTYSIAAVKCADYTAYCFNEKPSGCHQRYCFDVEFLSTTAMSATEPNEETVATAGCYSKSENEVCQTKQEIPFMYSRGPDTTVNEKMFDRTFCDVYAIDTGLWYYSMNNMTEHCPEMYKCGTQFPIWLNGRHPEAANIISNLTACLRDFDSCCLKTYSIAVVKCLDTTAYCFNELPSGCHQRYCFDVEFVPTTTMTAEDPEEDRQSKRDAGHVLIIVSAVLLVAVLGVLSVILAVFIKHKRRAKVVDKYLPQANMPTNIIFGSVRIPEVAVVHTKASSTELLRSDTSNNK